MCGAGAGGGVQATDARAGGADRSADAEHADDAERADRAGAEPGGVRGRPGRRGDGGVRPAVRVAGSNATAKILSQFWVAIPVNDIRKLLNRKLLFCVKVTALVMFCL